MAVEVVKEEQVIANFLQSLGPWSKFTAMPVNNSWQLTFC